MGGNAAGTRKRQKAKNTRKILEGKIKAANNRPVAEPAK